MSAVRFETEFDTRRETFTAPLKIASGQHPVVAVVDGFLRGEAVVGRFENGPGLVGFAVHSGGVPVDVTVTVAADRRTPEFNDRGLAMGAPRPHDPRLLLVRSQGRTRAATLLSRGPHDFTFRTRTTVRFRVESDEISEDGLFVLELADSALDVDLGIAPYAAAGVRIDAVTLALAAADPVNPPPLRTASGLITAGRASTGLPMRGGKAHLGNDMFTVAPGEVTSWRLRARRVRPVRPDPVIVSPGAPWPRETPATQLRMRQKVVLLVKFRARQAWLSVRRRARHVLARAGRVADAPFGWAGATRLGGDIRQGRLTAQVLLLDTGVEVPSTLRHAGGRDVVVTATGPIDGPAVVRLAAPPPRRSTSFRYAWRLISGEPAPPTGGEPG
ncbi:MAG TPA: hypothetical protein VKB69_10375 [Micromonosporaceae bacterium]|nr:hypothetical protein [Micromonosporaceae bacterium]